MSLMAKSAKVSDNWLLTLFLWVSRLAVVAGLLGQPTLAQTYHFCTLAFEEEDRTSYFTDDRFICIHKMCMINEINATNESINVVPLLCACDLML